MNPGQPDIPGLSTLLLIPTGTVMKVSVEPGVPMIINSVLLAPVQAIPDSNGQSEFSFDQAVYSSTTEFPADYSTQGEIRTYRDQESVVVNINPIQYIPSIQQLLVYTNMHISIDFIGSVGPLSIHMRDINSQQMLRRALNWKEVITAEKKYSRCTEIL